MSHPLHKMSDMLKSMMLRLFRNPDDLPSAEAAHLALFLANIAWNECVGLDHPREACRNIPERFESENPALWNEFKLKDVDQMIDELVEYKQQHFPHDRRRILTCGIPDGVIRVEWLPPAAPGVDSKWEMRLFGLNWTNQRKKAVSFLQKTRNLPLSEAIMQVDRLAMSLDMSAQRRE